MKRVIVIICTILLLVSCAKEGVPASGVIQPGSDDFQVTFLFEIDGVQIYRFSDGGEYRYFSTGNGSFQPQTQKRTTSSGKSTTVQTWTDGVYNGD